MSTIRETVKRNMGRGKQWEFTERRKRRQDSVEHDGEDAAETEMVPMMMVKTQMATEHEP